MASIIRTECGKVDDEAVNMDWMLGYKRGVVINARCLKCGGELQGTWRVPGVLLVVLEEMEKLSVD